MEIVFILHSVHHGWGGFFALWACDVETTVVSGANWRFLFLRMIKNTIPFKTPPMLENVVRNTSIAKGTLSTTSCQAP